MGIENGKETKKEKYDFHVNINDLKVMFWDELVEISSNGDVSCGFEEVFKGQIAFLDGLERYFG